MCWLGMKLSGTAADNLASAFTHPHPLFACHPAVLVVCASRMLCFGRLPWQLCWGWQSAVHMVSADVLAVATATLCQWHKAVTQATMLH